MRSAVFVAGLAACCPATTVQPASCPELPRPKPTVAEPAANPLVFDAASPLRTRPELHARLKRSPHHYFRAANAAFARDVCRRFADVQATMPIVNLHGDAHLEQVALTDEGAGLSDFDDSVTGPPVIDLVRFGTSVALAADQHGWGRDEAVKRFLDAYVANVVGEGQATRPAALERLRVRFGVGRGDFLGRAEQLMTRPVPPAKEKESSESWKRYVALMRQLDPTRPADFFRVKKRGEPTPGVGSATIKRVLYRIEGPTDDGDDDVILEAKEMRDVSDIPCVEGRGGLAVRIILSATRFGAKPDPFLAIVPRGREEDVDDPPWWIQSWWANYAEINIETSLPTKRDLHEVSAFAADHLARGHTAFLPEPYDAQLRILLHNMMSEHRSRVETAIRELTRDTLQAHAAF